MSVSLEHLLMILALAGLTYLARMSGLLLDARDAPLAVSRVLHYIPIAAFAALIAPGLIVPEEVAPRLIAAICCGLLALRQGRLWVALFAGMVVYWALRAAGL